MINGLPSAAGYSASEMINPLVEAGAERDGGGDELTRRRARARAVDDVLRGEFQHLVDEVLEEKFHPKTYQEMSLQSGISARINIMRDCTDKIVRSAWPDADWQLAPKGDGEPINDPGFEQWKKATEPNALAVRIIQNILNHPGYLVIPCVYEVERTRERKVGWRCYSPAYFDIVGGDHADDWEELHIYEDPEGRLAKEERYRITSEWVEEQVRLHNGNWMTTERKPNRYGRVLGEVFRLDPHSRWSANYGLMLLQSTLEANAAQSLATLNAAGQIKMISGVFEGMAKGMRGRHGALLDTPATGTGADILDLTTDGEAFRRAYIEAERRMCAIALGLPADEFESTTVPPSGESLKLRYFGLSLFCQRVREAILPGLTSLYWQSLHVLRTELTVPPYVEPGEQPEEQYQITGFPNEAAMPTHTPNVGVLDQPVMLMIDVSEATIPETQAERQARIDFDIKHGLTTDAKIAKQENPDIEDGVAFVDSNKKEQAKIDKANAPRTPVVSMLQQRNAPPFAAKQG